MTLELNELIDIFRDYEFEQECIMDDAKSVDSYVYQKANAKWHAANEIFVRIYNKRLVDHE